ncbi:MAG: hypothetical protein D0528_04360 [Methylococcales bacterium]|nr:MAG: hypothetical protein D0528_04360 [Methylococcales bacterium]
MSVTGQLEFNLIDGKECPTAQYYAGIVSSDSAVLKYSLLAAKAAGNNIRVTIAGCNADSGNGWFNIAAIYIDQ